MQKLKDTLSQATKQAKAEFDAKIVKFMTENPEKPHRMVADWFGVHRNYVGQAQPQCSRTPETGTEGTGGNSWLTSNFNGPDQTPRQWSTGDMVPMLLSTEFDSEPPARAGVQRRRHQVARTAVQAEGPS